jgi:hypothetical protein
MKKHVKQKKRKQVKAKRTRKRTKKRKKKERRVIKMVKVTTKLPKWAQMNWLESSMCSTKTILASGRPEMRQTTLIRSTIRNSSVNKLCLMFKSNSTKR